MISLSSANINLLQKLNGVSGKIQFTVESECDCHLPFLVTVVMRPNKNLNFKLYRKPANKNDFFTFHSAHNKLTKPGVAMNKRTTDIVGVEMVTKVAPVNERLRREAAGRPGDQRMLPRPPLILQIPLSYAVLRGLACIVFRK